MDIRVVMLHRQKTLNESRVYIFVVFLNFVSPKGERVWLSDNKEFVKASLVYEKNYENFSRK